MSVLVWIEQLEQQAVASCWEVLGKGRQIANELGTTLSAVVIGAETATTAAAAQRYGVDQVWTATDPALASYRLSAYGAVLQAALTQSGATVLLTSATPRGRELSATVACVLGVGLAPDAIDLRLEAGKLIAVRSLYSGNILADVTFTSALQVISIRPRSFPLPEAGAATGTIAPLSVTVDESTLGETVLASQTTDSGEVSLTDARVIVSGGRGVATDPATGFALVADLAAVLGAAIGASRAAVDAGYIPYKYQVGQTGKTVRPDLYMAAGISGAIQHLAGMGSSKVVVAINKDREAPIFSRAHYGIVGDLFTVLPALTAEFKKRLGK
ncbi:MAG: electron transfer flavoprotein subunit alpha/FixB family protein [Caldilineaceae bacterium]|nr:electron transfer flavoprotein subunit alpha/FixB family protein [Caldilineaceae bacterium]